MMVLSYRDPTTGWGSMDFTHFSALFDVATPYTPPDDNSDGGNGLGVKLSAIQIAIIVVVIGVVLILLSFLYACFYKRCHGSNAPPRQARQRGNYHGTDVVIINAHDAAAIPVTIAEPSAPAPPSGRVNAYAVTYAQPSQQRI